MPAKRSTRQISESPQADRSAASSVDTTVGEGGWEKRIVKTTAALEAASRALLDLRPEQHIGRKIPAPAVRRLSPLDRARALYGGRQQQVGIAVPRALATLDAGARPLPQPSNMLPQPYVLRHPATQDEVGERRAAQR